MSRVRPTAGIDPQELIDTRPYAREWHYHILNDRSLTGLPRKFNVAFDGAGSIAVLEDTNDIAFRGGRGQGRFWRRARGLVSAGDRRHYRPQGFRQRHRHRLSNRKSAYQVADAIVRVFIETGDRTNRLKARMKYVIDGMGIDKFLLAGRSQIRQAL